MSFLSTGVPIYDVVIALLAGYFVAWFFRIRPLRHQLEEDGTRNFEADTELRTSNRSLDRMRGEVKGMQAKLATTEATLATTNQELAKAQSELEALTKEKGGTAVEMEARDQKIAELQSQTEQMAFDARNVALQAESVQLKANLAILAAESEAMKSFITAKQMENQLLRIQASNIPFQMAPQMPAMAPMPNTAPMQTMAPMQSHPQEAPTLDNSWLHTNFGINANQPHPPQYGQHNNDPEHHLPTTG